MKKYVIIAIVFLVFGTKTQANLYNSTKAQSLRDQKTIVHVR